MTTIDNWLTIDNYGMQMPWYTRPALEVINHFDFINKTIFEYGCGYSTLWFRSRGAKVYGVDSDMKWADLAGVRFEPVKDWYLECINYLNVDLDIVCIDGDHRDECFDYALLNLKKNGIIIIDNYEQPSVEPNDWSETNAFIKKHGFKVEIYKEPTHEDWNTAIIYT